MKLTPSQQRALEALDMTTPRCAYGLTRPVTSLATLRALERKGLVRDVTPFGAGGMFSPTTHYKFLRALPIPPK